MTAKASAWGRHEEATMDRLAAGVLIAGVALVLNAGMLKQALADAGAGQWARSFAQPVPEPAPAGRGKAAMSLVLALETLRAAPALLDGEPD
jgi:hypothetical protein